LPSTTTSQNSPAKQIVCLANARKNSGRCIAGKEVLAEGYGQWIRPVSVRDSAELSQDERRYENGVQPKVLDIVEIPLAGPKPQLHQSENYVVDSRYYWKKKGELTWPSVKRLVDKPVPLWSTGDSTQNGHNDRVKLETASNLTNSLMLIEPEDLIVRVGPDFGTVWRRLRARFRHAGTHYNLSVTDPVAEKHFLAKPNSDYKLSDMYLCISLGEPYTDGWCYKLVATIIGQQLP
jgi:hypothetical protein